MRKLLASSQGLQNSSDVVFLTPHLSPADLSPVLTMKRKLWNISMENQSFHEQWLLETARNIVLQSDSDHLLQENGFNATSTPPVGCEWHYNITLYHNVPIRLSVLTLTVVQRRWASKPFRARLAWHDWQWGSEPISAVLQCRANSWWNRSKLLTFHPLANISLISKRTHGHRIR